MVLAEMQRHYKNIDYHTVAYFNYEPGILKRNVSAMFIGNL